MQTHFNIPLPRMLGLFQIWSLEVFTSMFCSILWKRVNKYPKHLYSSVFFLNEPGFSLAGLSFVFVYAYFQCLDKRTVIQSTINTLPWFKGEGRKLLAYRKIYEDLNHMGVLLFATTIYFLFKNKLNRKWKKT